MTTPNPQKILNKIAIAVRVARTKRELTVQGLAKLAGISPGTIKRLERGEDTSIGTLSLVASGLDVTIAQLIGEETLKPREITFYEALSVVQDRFAKLRRGEIDDDVLDEKALLAYIADKSSKGE